jgi:competence protein ComEA
MEEQNEKMVPDAHPAALHGHGRLAKVNINTAKVDELATLPGIGPAKAEAIVKYRKDHGKFKKIEDLKEVKGIGDKIIEKIKPEATVKK